MRLRKKMVAGACKREVGVIRIVYVCVWSKMGGKIFFLYETSFRRIRLLWFSEYTVLRSFVWLSE